MRRMLIASGLLALAVMSIGCATAYPDGRGPNAALLFDRVPGQTLAMDLPPRSEWPSAPAGVQLRQKVYFTEVFEDRQGRSRNPEHSFHRSFTTRRSGFIVR